MLATIISSSQALLFTLLFIGWFKPTIKSWEPYVLISIITVNTISVVTSTDILISLVDGFGACVLGFVLYKDYIKSKPIKFK